MSNSKKKAARKNVPEPKNPKKLIRIVCVAVVAVCLVACGVWKLTSGKANKADEPFRFDQYDFDFENAQNPLAAIVMEDGGVIIAELYPEVAPNTVANFVSLASSGFYDGLTFHRVIPGFMIQGGDPAGNGSGDPGYSIRGEFAANGFENSLAHTRGVLSMARSMMPDSAGSQFFIMHENAPHLDGQYAAFGQVVYGMDTVDKIAQTQTDANDRPLKEQKILKIIVDTKGIEYSVEKIGG